MSIRMLFFLMYLSFNNCLFAQTFSQNNVLTIFYDPYGENFSSLDLNNENMQNLNGAEFVLVEVCLNIMHNWVGDIVVALESPNGTTVLLTENNGSFGDNYENTCFTLCGEDGPISAGAAPFTGNFEAEENLDLINDNSNPNGVWKLFVSDVNLGLSGALLNWSLTFGPPINAHLQSDDTCFSANYNSLESVYKLHGDFTNCNIFVLDENENVISFLLNFSDVITIYLDELPAGLHFVRVEHQIHENLSFQNIIKQ